MASVSLWFGEKDLKETLEATHSIQNDACGHSLKLKAREASL